MSTYVVLVVLCMCTCVFVFFCVSVLVCFSVCLCVYEQLAFHENRFSALLPFPIFKRRRNATVYVPPDPPNKIERAIK